MKTAPINTLTEQGSALRNVQEASRQAGGSGMAGPRGFLPGDSRQGAVGRPSPERVVSELRVSQALQRLAARVPSPPSQLPLIFMRRNLLNCHDKDLGRLLALVLVGVLLPGFSPDAPSCSSTHPFLPSCSRWQFPPSQLLPAHFPPPTACSAQPRACERLDLEQS